MITIKRVETKAELKGIKALQDINLIKNLPAGESVEQGFVTAEYSLDFLERMHRLYPSVIAMDGDQLAGYALVATKAIRSEHTLLGDLFNTIDETEYKNQFLKFARYVIVGQLCVAKNYRGIGLVQQMYQRFKTDLSADFDYCLTDVADDNPRSLKAHLNSGFRVVKTFAYGGQSWQIVLWDWTLSALLFPFSLLLIGYI